MFGTIVCPNLSLGCSVITQAWFSAATSPFLAGKVDRDRGRQVLAQPHVDEQTGGEVRHEGDNKRGDRASPDDTYREGKREGEQCVADGDDPLRVEDTVLHASVHVHERRPPPCDQRDEREGDHHRDAEGEAELAGDPATAGNALCPIEAIGAALELCDERRREQHADDSRQQGQPAEQTADLVEAILEGPDCVAAPGGGCAPRQAAIPSWS